VLLGEMPEMPTVVSGDTAGYFLNSPVQKIKLTCTAAGETEERTLLAAVESGAAPQQVLYLKPGGDFPALVKLIVTDKATQDRRYFRYGQDLVASETGNPPTLVTAGSLVTTGFSGEAKTRTGAYSEEKVKRATAVSQWTTMCGTGAIKHVGSFRIFGHVYAASEDARYRISYRNGDGPLVALEGKAPPIVGDFSDIDFGEVTFDEASTGEQHSEIRVEVKTAGEPLELDLNYLELVPTTKGYGKARGLASSAPTKLLAYDTFLQTEGNLDAPKALPLGGNWAEATKTGAAGFKVIAAEDLVQRVEVSDASAVAGCYAIAGTEEPTTSKVSVVVWSPTVAFSSATEFRRGVFLRYTNPENWLMAYFHNSETVRSKLAVAKRVAGTTTVLDDFFLAGGVGVQEEKMVVSLTVDANGTWQASMYLSGSAEPSPMLEGQDSVLATGGTLAKGKGGFYDAWLLASACTRNYDSFSLLTGDAAGRVCYSTRTCRATSEGFTRQDSTGAYEGTASEFRGANLYLPPGGKDGLYNRIVISMRRNDAEAEASPNVTDKHKTEVLVKERFLVPR
jgi:hypothetical protein